MSKVWKTAVGLVLISIVTSISFVFLPWELDFGQNNIARTTFNSENAEYDLTMMKQWFNVLTMDETDISGGPLLIVFFNFTDVDNLDAIQRVEEFYKKYSDNGLSVIGVHSANYEFEMNSQHIGRAIEAEKVSFPVTTDFEWQNWHKYKVKGLPAWYLYDANGELEFQAHGSLDYQQLEQRLKYSVGIYNKYLSLRPSPPELDVETKKTGRKVLYAGFKKNSLGQISTSDEVGDDGTVKFKDPKKYDFHKIYLHGGWRMTDDTLTPSSMKDAPYIVMKYGAIQKVYGVFGSSTGEKMKVYLTLDGKPIPKEKAGPQVTYDKKGKSFIQVYQPQNYVLIDSFERENHVLKMFPDSEDFDFYSLTLEP